MAKQCAISVKSCYDTSHYGVHWKSECFFQRLVTVEDREEYLQHGRGRERAHCGLRLIRGVGGQVSKLRAQDELATLHRVEVHS